MSPYDLQKAIEKAEQTWSDGRKERALFGLLVTLIKHEADVEADRNLRRHHEQLAAENIQHEGNT